MSPPSLVMVALLGRQDSPTDALDDYCARLADSLARKGVALEVARLPWAERGWFAALRGLRKQAAMRRGRWVLVQYTALAWSRRGFPGGLLLTIRQLKRMGIRVAIVFHDPSAFQGERFRDRVRRAVQEWVMRSAARRADKCITAVSPHCMPWMQDSGVPKKIVVIPIGSNIPERWKEVPRRDAPLPAVAVFGVTERNEAEAAQIARTVKRAAERMGPLKLIVAGRGAPEAEKFLQVSLANSPVRLELHGILAPEKISELLSSAHAQLFARSGIAARRGSVVAGIACGLPIVGWQNEETAFPVTEAGIRAVPMGDEDSLVRELVTVLTDAAVRAQLEERSRRAAQLYFSWESVAERFMEVLSASAASSTGEARNG